jgi:hypothetical protein
LYFEPPTSAEDSDDSEDPDYRPQPPLQPYLTGSDESISGSLPALSNQNISLSNQPLPKDHLPFLKMNPAVPQALTHPAHPNLNYYQQKLNKVDPQGIKISWKC